MAGSKKIPLTAGILAGGKSSRMGKNKAFLLWKHGTMLENMLEIVNDFEQILISVPEGKQQEQLIPYKELLSRRKWKNVALVADVRKAYGPLEGVYQLLKHAQCEWVFIIATDMPMINLEFISGMVSVISRQRKDDMIQAVIVKEENRVHPLCGLYHISILPVLERLLEEDCHRMMMLLQEISVKYISLEEIGADPGVLTNVNTPEEYNRMQGEENEGCNYYVQ